MKNMKSIVLCCGAMLICMAAFTSCGNSESSKNEDVTKKPVPTVSLDDVGSDVEISNIEGKWGASGLIDTLGNVTSIDDIIKDGGNPEDWEYELILNADKSGSLKLSDGSVNGTWGISDSKVTFSCDDGTAFVFEVQSDGTLNMRLSDRSEKLVFNK